MTALDIGSLSWWPRKRNREGSPAAPRSMTITLSSDCFIRASTSPRMRTAPVQTGHTHEDRVLDPGAVAFHAGGNISQSPVLADVAGTQVTPSGHGATW